MDLIVSQLKSVLSTLSLPEENKRVIDRLISEWEKEYHQLNFRIERLEKDKKTLGIMLEESIEDLNKKTLTIEKSNVELSQALKELKDAQSQLIQREKMASLGELTAGIAHEIKNPLNFVNNFSEINIELADELVQAADIGDPVEIKVLAADIRANQEKIREHGKRADGIVSSMLQHSRTSSGQKELTDINKLIQEYVNLAFHGMRAKEKSFNCTLEQNLDPSLQPVEIIPQDFGRVILNLLNNAFYAVNEKLKASADNYQPTVTITSKKLSKTIEIAVTDNGIGIPDQVRDKIFQPFFTTKPTGEGTGLGLSLSYDIITKGHGGEMIVESNPGDGTRFLISLPIL